jgi:hypothetical protein
LAVSGQAGEEENQGVDLHVGFFGVVGSMFWGRYRPSQCLWLVVWYCLQIIHCVCRNCAPLYPSLSSDLRDAIRHSP